MKKICIFIAIFLISTQLRGQKDNQLNKLLIESILLNIDYDSDLYSKVCSTCGAYTLPYICRDGLPADFPYDSLQHIDFFTFHNIEGYPSSFKKKLKKGIGAWTLGIRLTNNVISIIISSRSVKRIKKRHIGAGVSGSSIYIYEYSCEKQEWELKETKHL